MKNLYLCLLLILLFSCESEKDKTLEDYNPKAIQENASDKPEEVLANFPLDASASKANWERTLDQKPTKQKVKVFGKEVDVQLGAVKLNSSGNVSIKSGEWIEKNNEPYSSKIIFDMSTIQLSKEKDGDLFDTKNYPNSELEIKGFVKNDSILTANAVLTIQKTTKELSFPIQLSKTGSTRNVRGSFIINTLDFPLREQVKAKDVNKDEIKVKFEFNYTGND